MAFRPTKISVSALVGGAIVALILVLVGIVLTVNYRSSRADTVELLARTAAVSTDILEGSVRTHLDDAAAQATALAEHLALSLDRHADRDALALMLAGAFTGPPQVFALTVMAEGLPPVTMLRDRRDPHETVLATDSEVMAAIARRAAASETSYWDEIRFAPHLRHAFVGHVAPIRRDGRPAGFVAAYVVLSDLSEFMIRIGDRFKTNAYLLQDDRRVIAHPLLVQGHPDVTAAEPLVQIRRLGDPVLMARASGRSMSEIDDLTGPETTIARVELGGTGYIFLERTIGGYGATPWIAGVYLHSEILEGHLAELRRTALIGVGVALIGIVVALLIGRAIARPIAAMSRGAARVAELDLRQVQRLPASFLLELDAQASSFNRMLGALRWFEVYVPRALVGRLVRGGAEDIPSVEREVTVLFTDLVGFSAAAETLGAAETAELLNRHFTLVAACVEAEGGTIDKFIGDALMAFWNAPEPQPDHAARGVRAALAAARAVAAENGRRRAAGLAPLGIRLGLHSGPAVVGNIGAPGRMNYTAVGDAINVGQRLEALGKTLAPEAETVVLISGAVALRLGPAFRLTPMGAHAMKGHPHPVEVFRVEDAEARPSSPV